MKKVTQILAAIVLSVGFVGITSSAANALVCEGQIQATGPGSNNEIVCVNEEDVTVVCNGEVYVANVNEQDGESGDGDVDGNTNGGSVVTGEVVNYNGTNITVGVTGCGTPAAPVTPETPSTPVVPTAAPAGKGQAAALPYTAANSALETALIAIIALATAAVTARLAVAVYRRVALK